MFTRYVFNFISISFFFRFGYRVQLLLGEEDQKVATIAIFVHEIMEAEMASFRRENLMHQVYGVKNWISDCLAYLQNFLQKGLKSSALPLTKSQRIKAKRKYFLLYFSSSQMKICHFYFIFSVNDTHDN